MADRLLDGGLLEHEAEFDEFSEQFRGLLLVIDALGHGMSFIGLNGGKSLRESVFRDGEAEPGVKARRADAMATAGDQGAVVEFAAEIAGMDIGDHRAWILVCGEELAG